MTPIPHNDVYQGLRRPVQTSLIEGLERPVGPILASVFTGTNAELMAAVAPLYLAGSVLDVTYGRGGWWDRYRPNPFTIHDLALDGVDFRGLPEGDSTFDTVCFDPPYVDGGGVGSLDGFQDRYGIGYAKVGGGLQMVNSLILGGLVEACRVANRYVLVKCMEYAQGGKFHDVPFTVSAKAQECGWVKHDQIVHWTGTGPGGHNIFTVKRARRAHSYLLVFCRA